MNEPFARAPVMVREPALRDRLAAAGQRPALPADEIAGTEPSLAPRRPIPGDQPPRPANAEDGQAQRGLQLLSMGRSLGTLALAVIVTLSAGIVLLFYSRLHESPGGADVLGEPVGLLAGFGFLMLMTLIYLVAKQVTTRRRQRRMIERILEQEAIAWGLRKNPLIDYHHPDVCREVLIQQASHAARLQAPLSLLEVRISGLAQMAQDADMQPDSHPSALPKSWPKPAEWVRKIKELCRATDSVLRWTPESFLLAFPEVAGVELVPIRERLREGLEQWVEERYEEGSRQELQWRGATSSSLDSGGDILLETRRLLESEFRSRQRLAGHNAQDCSALPPSDKSISPALDLGIGGEGQNKKPFEQKIVAEHVGRRLILVPARSAPDGASPADHLGAGQRRL